MMSKITTRSTSTNSAVVEQDLIIDENTTTRRIFRAVINDVNISNGQTVGGTIIHQRKGRNDEWQDHEPIILSKLKTGEGVRLQFHSEALKKFFDILNELYRLGQEGVHFGTREFLVGEVERFIEVPRNRKNFVQKLIELDFGEEIWEELIDNNPDLVTRLSRARIQHERSEALSEFEASIANEELDESYWQKFFQNNQWIFGYGLNYQFNSVLSDQPHYGGTDFTGTGAQRGDFLLSSNAIAKFTCLVEIKKPTTKLFTYQNGEPKIYRNGACLISGELAGAVCQIQVNCKTWEDEAKNPQNYRTLHRLSINTIQPKGILIIGLTSELKSDAAIETFELYRRNIVNPEIMTFDELLERARFIVDKDSNSKNEIETTEPDIEF